MERIIHTFIDPENIDIEFVEKVPEHNVSDISDKNLWWTEFRQSFKELKMEVEPEVPVFFVFFVVLVLFSSLTVLRSSPPALTLVFCVRSAFLLLGFRPCPIRPFCFTTMTSAWV